MKLKGIGIVLALVAVVGSVSAGPVAWNISVGGVGGNVGFGIGVVSPPIVLPPVPVCVPPPVIVAPVPVLLPPPVVHGPYRHRHFRPAMIAPPVYFAGPVSIAPAVPIMVRAPAFVAPPAFVQPPVFRVCR